MIKGPSLHQWNSTTERNARLKLGKEGISFDYVNFCIEPISRYCDQVLHGERANSPYTKEELQARLLKEMKSFRSYDEYIETKEQSADKSALHDAITKKGQEIIEELDRISSAIHQLAHEDPTFEDVSSLPMLEGLLRLAVQEVNEQKVIKT